MALIMGEMVRKRVKFKAQKPDDLIGAVPFDQLALTLASVDYDKAATLYRWLHPVAQAPFPVPQIK